MSRKISVIQDLDNIGLITALPSIHLDFTTAKELLNTRRDLLQRFGKLGLNLIIGIEEPDKILTFRFEQFAVLQGRPSNGLSSLLCIKAVLPKLLGTDSNVIFIDGGNIFDPYLISEHSIEHGLDPERVLERIHVSRAFTYHQLTTLLFERLPSTLDLYNAKLVVVSDMTLQYCDPDIRGADKQDALGFFLKTVKFLRALAERKHVLILATNLHSRNQRMDNLLLHAAHIIMNLEDAGTFTELSILKHPWIPQLKVSVPKSHAQTLEAYL